ncbi:MAG: TerB family tellurite resistance protein [Alphaproteobacteria bacterium]|nr:TerB family tellurite resistance protein [Alphaproteobacteria bacterium]
MNEAIDDGEDIAASLLDAMYALAATMIGADGRIEEAEIATAVRVGSSLVLQFDTEKFRQTCNNLDGLPNFARVVETLGDVLDDTEKDLLVDYLQQIAAADGEVADEEAALIDLARQTWNLT